jgi:hypothetical protein
LYDNLKQKSKRTFSLRNLSGESLEEQLSETKTIMNEVAIELYHITCAGIDVGEIKVGHKKVDGLIYPNFTPPVEKTYFKYGINIGFSSVTRWKWVLNKRHVNRISSEQLDEGWERQIIKESKTASFRLPCFVAFSHQDVKRYFIRYVDLIQRKRRTIGWRLSYDHQDELFTRFINRFHEGGRLCFGEKKYWASPESGYLQVTGTFWKVPDFKPSSLPRGKSRLASQPTDNTEYVYLIQMGRQKLYKIGKSNNPQGRLANLQSANPHKLKLLHVFHADNSSAAEETLHAELHSQRMEGEWFKLTDKQKDALISVLEFKTERFFLKNHEQEYTARELLCFGEL